MNKTPFTTKSIKESACGHLNGHLDSGNLPSHKKSKYGNRKVQFGDVIFDSQKELNYYLKARMLVTAGAIRDLRLQVKYELNDGGTHSLVYIADFVFIDCKTGKEKVVDVKGYKTKVYLKKRRLMKQVLNIDIIEV